MDFDLVIIGGGPAGYTAGLEAVKRKLKTAIIEKTPETLGGTCLNEGCIPLKGLLHYSEHEKDYFKIKDKVISKVKTIREGLRSRLKSSGIEMIEGTASFIDAAKVSASGREITAKNFLIACGSVPKKIFSSGNVFTSERIFSLETKPETALIIGGGVIGCEYASFLNNIGVQVDMAEVMPSLIPGEDADVIRALEREFKKKKITLYTSSKVKFSGAECVIETPAGEVKKTYQLIIEATGRRAATEGLNLEGAGVKLSAKGFIETDDSMRTSKNNIFAAGDCIETPMLAYTAYKEAEIAVKAICGEAVHPIDYASMPKLVFSIPQAGSIGLSEEAANQAGINITVKKYFFKAIGKAVVESNDAGFLKLVIDEAGAIAGAAACGGAITELMNELAVIVKNKLTAKQLEETTHIHPSYGEIVLETLLYGN